MSEPRLLTDEELAAIRGRAEAAGKCEAGAEAYVRSMRADRWAEDAAVLFGHAPFDLPALLAHADAQTGVIRDICEESRAAALALRYRAALERIAATSPPHQGWAADVARAALEAD